MEDPINYRITRARQETKQLYQQIDKIKAKIQDTTLAECSKGLPTLSKSINLKPFKILKGHNNKIADFKWSLNSDLILSCSQDGFLIIWDSKTGYKLNAIPLNSQWVLSCGISPNTKLLAIGGLTNNLTIYQNPEFDNSFQSNILTVFKGHVCGITCLDFIDNNRILTGSGDMTCKLWDINKSKKIGNYLDHFGDVLTIDVDKNSDNLFLSGSSDGYARLYDIRTGHAEQKFFISNSDLTSIKFFKDSNSFINGSDDGIIRFIDLRADCEISRYNLSNSMDELAKLKINSIENNFELNSNLDSFGVTSLDFSSSGRLIYGCYSNYGCLIWDTLKSELIGKLDGHLNRVTKVSSSPNGYGVCTGSWDSTMRIWTPSYV